MIQPEDPWADLPKTRKEAKSLNTKKFYTGTPCMHGHLTPRITANGNCSACQRIAARKWTDKNRDSINAKNLEYMKGYTAKNKEVLAAKSKAYREENKGVLAAQGARYRRGNKEKIKASKKRYGEENKDSIRTQKTAYREANKESVAKQQSAWYFANKEHVLARVSLRAKEKNDKVNANIAKRRADKKNATPAWADLKAIAALYTEAKRLDETTGIKHHVDHIFPLRGKLVSGLHVENNLRVITAEENLLKNNKLLPEFASG